MNFQKWIIFVVIYIFNGWFLTSEANQIEISGTIVDIFNNPIKQAFVKYYPEIITAETDSMGKFVLLGYLQNTTKSNVQKTVNRNYNFFTTNKTFIINGKLISENNMSKMYKKNKHLCFLNFNENVKKDNTQKKIAENVNSPFLLIEKIGFERAIITNLLYKQNVGKIVLAKSKLKLLNPTKGELYYVGDTLTISIINSDSLNELRVFAYLSTDNGKTFFLLNNEYIMLGPLETNDYKVHLSDYYQNESGQMPIISDSCIIKVEDYMNPKSYWERNEGTFAIRYKNLKRK